MKTLFFRFWGEIQTCGYKLIKFLRYKKGYTPFWDNAFAIHKPHADSAFYKGIANSKNNGIRIIRWVIRKCCNLWRIALRILKCQERRHKLRRERVRIGNDSKNLCFVFPPMFHVGIWINAGNIFDLLRIKISQWGNRGNYFVGNKNQIYFWGRKTFGGVLSITSA